MCRQIEQNFNNLTKFDMKQIISIMRKTKAFFIRFVICRLFGHSINRYLIEYSKQKECTRCGEIITVWDIMTVEDFKREKGV